MLIVTAGGTPSALAAKAATSTIPIVFLSGGDPVKLGLVGSLNQPGGSVTGISQFTNVLIGKRLEFLRELVPRARSIAFLLNKGNPNSEADTKEIEESAKKLGLKLNVLSVGSDSEIEAVFASLQATEALLVATDPFLDDRRERVVALIARQRIPAIYGAREYAVAGGLISYGTNFADTY